MTPADCERLRDVAPELALGIADGRDRAWALDHLAGCAGCRAHLERLAAVADELPLLAPAAEPAPGFEQRVVWPLPGPRRPSRARRLAVPALAAVAAAAIATVVAWGALDDERKLAEDYRETLAVADGEYFDAAPLEAPGGEKAGYVYGYQGRASWVFAVVYADIPDGSYRLAAVSQDGRGEPLRRIRIDGAEGSGGAVTQMPYDRVAEVLLLDPRGREVAQADLHD